MTVYNPDGERATLPYRFQVERAIEPEVTIGLGGPRVILAGDTGTYSVTLQGRSNLDTPYVFYEVGIPEMGPNPKVYGLPFVTFASNLRGSLADDSLSDVPWASLDSAVNTDGYETASGYLFDQPAAGFNGFTFDVATYPGLREMHDRAYEQLRNRLVELQPGFADLLTDDPASLGPWWNEVRQSLLERFPDSAGAWIMQSYLDAFKGRKPIPSECVPTFIPFQFHVVAAATAMTRDEFIAHQRSEAEKLRQSILQRTDVARGCWSWRPTARAGVTCTCQP